MHITKSTGLANTYGEVEIIVKNENGKFKYYWSLDDCFGVDIQEIPEYLYTAILKYIEGQQ
jgi:hypothetical protein